MVASSCSKLTWWTSGWVFRRHCFPALFLRSGNSHTGEWHITVHESGGGKFSQLEHYDSRPRSKSLSGFELEACPLIKLSCATVTALDKKLLYPRQGTLDFLFLGVGLLGFKVSYYSSSSSSIAAESNIRYASPAAATLSPVPCGTLLWSL